ncbi:MAG: hypothetical protein J6S51_01905 [Kiritimatiellae bacterium]|nr:hypothetical protein [Kiritimatiellia bacterium]
MKTLYIERSVGGGRDGAWVNNLDLAGVERIIVGVGPGSFAGIRSALAFAKGFSIGSKCQVFGLPSPCAVAAKLLDNFSSIAVVGDARQGKIWVALFTGYELKADIFQVDEGELKSVIPEGWQIVTSDAARIGERLKELFGEQYLGGYLPDVQGLEKFAEKNPSLLIENPLPMYLNPAVRT